jgi:hypothetical protein
MPQSIEPSTLRILHPSGKTVGTGFLVAKNLAVTCSHVVYEAEAVDGDTLQVQFTGQEESINAHVLPEFWMEIGQGDIAFLKLESGPPGILLPRLASAAGCQAILFILSVMLPPRMCKGLSLAAHSTVICHSTNCFNSRHPKLTKGSVVRRYSMKNAAL